MSDDDQVVPVLPPAIPFARLFEMAVAAQRDEHVANNYAVDDPSFAAKVVSTFVILKTASELAAVEYRDSLDLTEGGKSFVAELLSVKLKERGAGVNVLQARIRAQGGLFQSKDGTSIIETEPLSSNRGQNAARLLNAAMLIELRPDQKRLIRIRKTHRRGADGVIYRAVAHIDFVEEAPLEIIQMTAAQIAADEPEESVQAPVQVPVEGEPAS
jgi:hypothetical protein